MTSLYFEQCIHNTKISTKTLIKLSECQRAFNKLHNLETGKQYYDQLKGLIKMIRYRRIPIKVHPQFECEGYQSTNWNFDQVPGKEGSPINPLCLGKNHWMEHDRYRVY